MPALTRPPKIAHAEMRDTGARGVLVYCQDINFSHTIAISTDPWPDEVRLSDLERRSSARPARRIAPNVQHTEDTRHLRHRRVGA